MESLLKNLEEQVTCSICLDTYTNPKTIACLHTFCCECLERNALTRQKQGLYRCPECQAQILIPEGNRFDNLPSSFLHKNLLSLLTVRRSGEGNEISCSTCQEKSVEINYCFNCEKFMCPDCVKAHEVLRDTLFEGHKVKPVRKFQAADYEALLKRPSFCSEKKHEKKETKLFCVGCQSCVCQVCINIDHKNHEVVPLVKVADDKKANIIARAEFLKEKKEVCREVILEYERTELELEANITTAKRKVSQVTEQMIGKLRQLEREAVTDLERARLSRIEKLNSGKALVISLEKQLDQAVEFSNNMVERSSSSDILQNEKNVKDRIEDLIKTKMPALLVRSFVAFVSTCEPESLSQLGFTKFSETDVQGSTVEGMDQNFHAGVEAELLICPKTSEGEIRNTQHTDRVEIQIDPSDEVRDLVTSEKEGGVFRVKFIAKVPGNFKMDVAINGQIFFNCPFTFEVKEREFDIVGKLDLRKKMFNQGPAGIAVNSKGVIAVADAEGHCILVFDKKGKFVRKIGYKGNKKGQFLYPLDVTFRNDVEILVADQGNDRIQQLNVQTGNFTKRFGKKGSGDRELKSPTSVCITSDGRFIVVAERSPNKIQVLTMNGEPVFKFGDSGPEGVYMSLGCVCYEDKFIITDYTNYCVKVFDSKGQFLYKFGEKGNGDGQLNSPAGLCVDKCGNLFVCDQGNFRIQQFTLEGTFIGKTGTRVNLFGPHGVATMPDDSILVTEFLGKEVKILR